MTANIQDNTIKQENLAKQMYNKYNKETLIEMYLKKVTQLNNKTASCNLKENKIRELEAKAECYLSGANDLTEENERLNVKLKAKEDEILMLVGLLRKAGVE